MRPHGAHDILLERVKKSNAHARFSKSTTQMSVRVGSGYETHSVQLASVAKSLQYHASKDGS